MNARTHTQKNVKHKSAERGSTCLQKLLDLLTANHLYAKN